MLKFVSKTCDPPRLMWLSGNISRGQGLSAGGGGQINRVKQW